MSLQWTNRSNQQCRNDAFTILDETECNPKLIRILFRGRQRILSREGMAPLALRLEDAITNITKNCSNCCSDYSIALVFLACQFGRDRLDAQEVLDVLLDVIRQHEMHIHHVEQNAMNLSLAQISSILQAATQVKKVRLEDICPEIAQVLPLASLRGLSLNKQNGGWTLENAKGINQILCHARVLQSLYLILPLDDASLKLLYHGMINAVGTTSLRSFTLHATRGLSRASLPLITNMIQQIHHGEWEISLDCQEHFFSDVFLGRNDDDGNTTKFLNLVREHPPKSLSLWGDGVTPTIAVSLFHAVEQQEKTSCSSMVSLDLQAHKVLDAISFHVLILSIPKMRLSHLSIHSHETAPLDREEQQCLLDALYHNISLVGLEIWLGPGLSHHFEDICADELNCIWERNIDLARVTCMLGNQPDCISGRTNKKSINGSYESIASSALWPVILARVLRKVHGATPAYCILLSEIGGWLSPTVGQSL